MENKNSLALVIHYPGRVNNVIFPVWFLLVLLPPFLFLFMLGNLFIDSLVITIVIGVNKYRTSLSKYLIALFSAFVIGYVSDFIGMSFIYFISNRNSEVDIYNAFSNITTLGVFILATILTSLLIFLLNIKVLAKVLKDKKYHSEYH